MLLENGEQNAAFNTARCKLFYENYYSCTTAKNVLVLRQKKKQYVVSDKSSFKFKLSLLILVYVRFMLSLVLVYVRFIFSLVLVYVKFSFSLC